MNNDFFEDAVVFLSSCPIMREHTDEEYDAEAERLQTLLKKIYNHGIDEAIKVVQTDGVERIVQSLNWQKSK